MLVKYLPAMMRYLAEEKVYVLFDANGAVMTERGRRALMRPGSTAHVSLDAATRQSSRPSVAGLFRARSRRRRGPDDAGPRRRGRAARLPWLTGLEETVAGLPALVPSRQRSG